MLAFVLAILISHPAYALDIERRRDGDWVVVTAVMSHSPGQVNALLAKHGETMKLGKGVRSVETQPLSDGCAHLTVRNRGFARDLSYTAERCPIENGWHSRMLHSDDFEEHEVVWSTVSEGSGSRTTIRVKVKLRVPVPDFLVQQFVGGALEGTLAKIDARLGGG